MQIGLFCGTFNPIHIGHLMIAECARNQFKLDEVHLVVSPRPPHRQDSLLDPEYRFELVKTAVKDAPQLFASRLEMDRPGPSYTVDTVKELLKLKGATCQINLIIGQDNLSHIKEWHESDTLFDLCRLLVAPRRILGEEQSLIDQGKEFGARLNIGEDKLSMIDFPPMSVSASEIRQRIRDNKSILYMVPDQVHQLILDKGYYRA